MKKLFGGLKMSWKSLISFAVAAGVYTGLVMLVPFLAGTSLQDIGITYEWWVVFAVVIVVNCRKNYEAMLKCFVFFLISQPLVYAVQIIPGALAFAQAKSYYLSTWLPMTVLTLPGGLIAYYCNKQNAIGSIILGIGCTIQGIMGVFYTLKFIGDFPYHFFTAAFSFASIIVMTLFIQKEKKNRIITFAVCIVLTAAVLVFAKLTGRTIA